MENVDNIIIEHLRHMRGKIDPVSEDVREIKHRLANVESSQGSIMQHVGHLASSIAQQQLSFDRLSDSVERLEKRLELTS